MARHKPVYSGRFHGTVKRNDLPKRPLCKHCGKPMRVKTHSKSRPVDGLAEQYDYMDVYYRCGQFECPGTREPLFSPPSLDVPPYGNFDYEVIAKAAEFRWRHHRTIKEIVSDFAEQYGITVSPATVGDWLKFYEIGCEGKYRPGVVEQMQANGGIILTVDVMKPLKGREGLATAHDELTGQALGSRKLASEDHEAIAAFLERVKATIKELGVPVLAIISDALVAQRMAIDAVFPGVPHCLCHFHFFNLVLKAPKELDSHVCTATRAALRKLPDLKKYNAGRAAGAPYVPGGSLADEVLDTLRALANWTRRPRDPCFTGLVLFERVKDVLGILRAAVEALDAGAVKMGEEKVIRCLATGVEAIASARGEAAAELGRVRGTLADLAAILSDLESSPEEGLRKLRKLRDRIRKARFAPGRGDAERAFAGELMKFVRTKGDLLFNYKRVPGAPRTNNKHELTYMQLKHFLRRVIGQAAANTYLLAHGERMVFVNPAESFDGIVGILRTMNYAAAREKIAKERKSRDRLSVVMHNPEKWEEKIKKMYKILKDLELPKAIIT
jgi:hypothetical protein